MKIVQKRWPFMTLSHEVKDRNVVVAFESLTAGSVETHLLFDLSETTERHLKRELRYLVGAAAFAFLTIPFIIDAATMKLGASYFFICVFGAGAIACAYTYLRHSFDRVYFTRHADGKTAFVMWYNKPNPEEFRKFYDYLIAEIGRARLNPRATHGQKMQAYQRALQFLCDEGVVTEAEANEFLRKKNDSVRKNQETVVVSIVK